MVGFPLGLQRACSVPAACTACFKFIIGYNSPIVKKKNGKNGKQINFKNPEIGPTWPRNRCDHIFLSHCFPHLSLTTSSNTLVALNPLQIPRCSLPQAACALCSHIITDLSQTPPRPRLRTRGRRPSRPSPPSREIWLQLYIRHQQDGCYRVQTNPGPSQWQQSDPINWRMRSADLSRLVATICHNPETDCPTENIPNIKIYVVFAQTYLTYQGIRCDICQLASKSGRSVKKYF